MAGAVVGCLCDVHASLDGDHVLAEHHDGRVGPDGTGSATRTVRMTRDGVLAHARVEQTTPVGTATAEVERRPDGSYHFHGLDFDGVETAMVLSSAPLAPRPDLVPSGAALIAATIGPGTHDTVYVEPGRAPTVGPLRVELANADRWTIDGKGLRAGAAPTGTRWEQPTWQGDHAITDQLSQAEPTSRPDRRPSKEHR